jgi:predicted nuclease with TOPRIM domain
MSAADIKQQFEIAKQGLKAIRDKNSTARQAAEQGNEEIIKEINEINDKIAKIKELVARSNELDSALKAKEDELENLNKEKGDLNKEFDDVKQERDNLQQRLKESEDNLQNVNAIIVTRDEEAREKENAMEELQRQIRDEKGRLEQINVDLQDLLADITQVNREIVETDGEVQTLNESNQQTVNNIKELLQKVNADLNDIINMPQPPASRMQQIHQDRMTKAAAAPVDGLGDGLGDMFTQKHQNTLADDAIRAEREKRRSDASEDINLSETKLFDQPEAEGEGTWVDSDGESDNEEEPLSPKDKAVQEASRELWWTTLQPQEQAMYRNVPEQRNMLRQEALKRVQEGEERRLGHRTPPAPPSDDSQKRLNMKYLTTWKNHLNDEENDKWIKGDDTVKAEMEALAKERMEKGLPTPPNVGPFNVGSFGGRRTRRRKAGLRMKSKTHKRGGYVAVYKKSSRRSSSKSKKTRSKRSNKSSKGAKSRKH